MSMRRIAAVVASVVACGATQSTPPETPNGGVEWKELRIAWDFGPCPSDGRSCHQVLTVRGDGAFTAAETPNTADAGPEPTRRFSALDPQEVRELSRIVTPEFLAKLGSFPCAPENDATIVVDIDGKKQEVGGCVHASADSPPRALVQLLERHRFASHEVPATHPIVPSGAGDPCTADVGCAKGLVCAIAPCVVAPCTSGTCRRTQ